MATTSSSTDLGGPVTVSTPASTLPRPLPATGEHLAALGPDPLSTTTTDQSSMSSLTADRRHSRQLYNWRNAKTRSEERYERQQLQELLPRGAGKPGRKEEALAVQELQARRARHLKNLRKEIRKLEDLDQKIFQSRGMVPPIKNNSTTDEHPSISRTNFSSEGAAALLASPARKLTFVRRKAAGLGGGGAPQSLPDVSDDLWDGMPLTASPDKTEHGVESILNTASSQRRGLLLPVPPLLQDKGVQAEVPKKTASPETTSFSSVSRSLVESSREFSSNNSSRSLGGGERRRGAGSSRSLQTETVQLVTRRIETRTDQSTPSSPGSSHPPPLVAVESRHQVPPERRTNRRRVPSKMAESTLKEPGRRQAWGPVEEREQVVSPPSSGPAMGEEEQLTLQLNRVYEADKENRAGKPKVRLPY